MPDDNLQWSEIRAKIARAVQELPALPIVVSRVMEETEKETVSATAIEKLIGSDPAIASKTLRIVNSAYYGMSRRIDSLSQAVVVLGVQQLRNLVLSISAMSMFRSRAGHVAQAHKSFWMHSIASASASSTVAKAKKLPVHDQEVAFVAGLLHDIGRLFLFTNFTDTYLAIDREYLEGGNLDELEIRALGLTHAQVGQVLAHVWRFPDPLSGLMGTHNGPFSDQSNKLAMTIHVAHLMADHLICRPGALQNIDPVALDWISDITDEMESIQIEVEARVHSYEQLYGAIAA